MPQSKISKIKYLYIANHNEKFIKDENLEYKLNSCENR